MIEMRNLLRENGVPIQLLLLPTILNQSDEIGEGFEVQVKLILVEVNGNHT